MQFKMVHAKCRFGFWLVNLNRFCRLYDQFLLGYWACLTNYTGFLLPHPTYYSPKVPRQCSGLWWLYICMQRRICVPVIYSCRYVLEWPLMTVIPHVGPATVARRISITKGILPHPGLIIVFRSTNLNQPREQFSVIQIVFFFHYGTKVSGNDLLGTLTGYPYMQAATLGTWEYMGAVRQEWLVRCPQFSINENRVHIYGELR